MKKKILKNLLLVSGCFLCFLLNSCNFNTENKEKTYTVWTQTWNNSNFESRFNTSIDDGYYRHYELSESEYDYYLFFTKDEDKHKYTKSELYDWFIGRRFDDFEANYVTNWITTVEHAILYTRTGNTVYVILK